MTHTRRLSRRLILWMSLCVWCAVILGDSIGVGQSVLLSRPSHVLRHSSFQIDGPWTADSAELLFEVVPQPPKK